MALRVPVLVTGATGFIGRRLVARLLEGDVEVAALALPDEPIRADWGGRVRIVRGDVRERGDVEAAVRGVGTVFHLAALVGDTGDYEAHWKITALGSGKLYEAAAVAGARVVVTTSICAYGDAIAKGLCREDTVRGRHQGPYGRAKQAQEDLAFRAAEEHGLAVTIVRPSNVYGIGSRPWVEGLAAGLRAGVVPVVGEGSGNAGLVHVENVVDALLRIGEREDTVGRVYNVCDGLDTSWRRYMDDIADCAGASAPVAVPREELYEAAVGNEDPETLTPPKNPAILPLEVLNLIGSDNRFDTAALRALGWSPRIGYTEAIEEIRRHLTPDEGDRHLS